MMHCAFCYDRIRSEFRCSECKKRLFCSEECQSADWNHGHRHWCGVTGEIAVDFEVRHTGNADKGLGLFALRGFKGNDKIMMERPAMNSPYEHLDHESEIESSVREAVMSLTPLDSDNITDKFALNSMTCTCIECPDKTSLFVTMSRVNHHCQGNAMHCYIEKHDVKILIAMTDIGIGEEITFPCTDGTIEGKEMLRSHWGFECNCSGCTNPEESALYTEFRSLDLQVDNRLVEYKPYEAIPLAKRIIEIYDQIGIISPVLYARTYNDLMCLCAMRKSTLDDARNYAKLCYEAEVEIYSGCKDMNVGNIQLQKRYMEDISCHPNYLTGTNALNT